MSKKIKIYVVGHSGPEHNSIQSIHRTYKGAFKAWDKLRISLLKDAKSFLNREEFDQKMYQKMVKNLSCKEPEKIDNGPHETPYILKWDLEE